MYGDKNSDGQRFERARKSCFDPCNTYTGLQPMFGQKGRRTVPFESILKLGETTTQMGHNLTFMAQITLRLR